MIDSPNGVGKFKPLRPAPSGPEKIKQQFKDVAQLYEKHFMREMMKAMRSTVPQSDFIKQNQGEKIFRGQLDDEYVEKWGDRGGIGLADMIYDQLIEKYGPSMGLKEPIEKPKGPIPMDEKSNSTHARVRVVPSSPEASEVARTQIKFDLSSKRESSPQDREVRAPWSGYLLKKIQLAPEEWFLEINHENGLNSQLLFKGIGPEASLGQKFVSGQKLGLLSPDSSHLSWSWGLGASSPQGQTESDPGQSPGPNSSPSTVSE